MAVVLASRRCLATGRKVPGRLARVGLGKSLQCTSEYPPASPTVCTWQVSSMSVFIVGSVSHFSHTLRSYGVSVEFSTGMFTTTHRHGVHSRSCVCICVSSSHGDLNQAFQAVCRSLAPFSGVPVSAWLHPAHPAHPWACQAPMRDCTTCRQDVNILQRAW